jgi:hypothetical protein
MMVICKTCGNNTCNGTYGQLPDGSVCPDCPSAYDMVNNTETPPLPTNHKEVSEKFHKEFQEWLDNPGDGEERWARTYDELRSSLIWEPVIS